MNMPPEMLARFVKFEEERLAKEKEQAQEPEARPGYTPQEVQAIIQIAVRDQIAGIKAALEQQQHENERLRAQMQFDLDRRLAELQRTAATPVITDPSVVIPPLDRVTKIEAQLFENFDEPKASKKPRVQLKLYVWTCTKRDMGKYRRGNCGEMYVPLHRPDRADGRKRIKEITPILDAVDPNREATKYAGCLVVGHKKHPDQAAFVTHTGKLFMDAHNEWLDFGHASPAPADSLPRAARMRWLWPDTFRD